MKALPAYARGLVAAMILAAGLASATPVAAYTQNMDGGGDPVHWTNSTIKWYLHPSGSDDVSFSQLKSAVSAAFQSYKSLSCFNKSFSYGGEKNFNPEDGIYIKFKESNWDPSVGDAAAYAQNWTTYGGKVNYTVMVFNGVDIEWTTTEADDFFSPKSDIQGVATHELGHSLGLDHSRVYEATMFFSGGSASLRSLEQDDKNGICFIYSNFTQGQPCDSCSSDGNCQSGFCLEYPDGLKFCGKNCTSDSNCPDLFYCYDLQGGSDQCVATNGYCSQTGSNIPLGNFCYGMETCESGLCLVLPEDAYCSKECTSDSQCPGSLKCISEVCIMGGSTKMGGTCKSHMDCESSMCLGVDEDSGVCTVECEEEGECPNGFGCSMGYCLKGGDTPFGKPCTYDMECETTKCIKLSSDEQFCSQTCDDQNDCPGFAPCTYSVCVPAGDTAFGEKCQLHSDCQSGFCAGSSNKFCSKQCEKDNQCQYGWKCSSSGYCIKAAAPSDQCMKDNDCDGGQFCKKTSADQPGKCIFECNPFADLGCEQGMYCRWLYVAFEDAIKGECLPDNGGAQLGQTCSIPNLDCQPHLVCMNVGGTGYQCYTDCNSETGLGCGPDEACLPLGMTSDPDHGVCVCSGASCNPEPEQDVTVQPTQDVTVQPDTTTTPTPDTGTTPKPDVQTQQPDEDEGGGGGGSDGCSAGPTPTSPALPLLLLLLLVLLSRLFTRLVRPGPDSREHLQPLR